MVSSRQTRREETRRIGITVSAEEKKKLEKAAEGWRMSVSSFVAKAAVDRANDFLRDIADTRKYTGAKVRTHEEMVALQRAERARWGSGLK